MSKKVVFVITDGIGYNKNTEFNAFYHAKKPNFKNLFKLPHSLIKTSGEAVGLPKAQMGNSEVGHMCIGAGRVIYQNLVKIDKSIEDKSLEKNEILLNFLKEHKRIHIIGLFSDGGVHSHLNHFNEIFNIAQKNHKEVFSHIITDGRDTDPKSAIKFINSAKNIASISGRFYAMDRDKRWDRIKKAYEVIALNKNLTSISPKEYIKKSYEDEIFDEFITPASFINFNGIQKDDGIIFINFRNDRAKELVSALGCEDFSEFEVKNTFDILTMTNYDDKFKFKILFDKEDIKNSLCEIVSKNNLTQAHIAETEKYAHVTFFLNGGREEPFLNETRILVPSPKVKTYDEAPEMSAYEVKDEVLKALRAGIDFIVVNFANGDMVGHTGNFKASIKAVEVIDECIGEIFNLAKDLGYSYIQASDHGNCEEMKKDDKILTNHTIFDVFCFVSHSGVDKINSGSLANIAPTILKMLGIEIPKEMQEPLF